MNDIFNRFAASVSLGLGHPLAFLTSLILILAWAGAGPAMGYSTEWIYLLTLTTAIATFLMTFVIVNKKAASFRQRLRRRVVPGNTKP